MLLLTHKPNDKQMSYIVALTGGIASGKTTIANKFAELGVPIVDADLIARQIVEPNSMALSSIIRRFGPRILNHDKTLNRKVLREIIFSQSYQKAWLNDLLHPLIQKETKRLFGSINAPYILWVIPLLIENSLAHLADSVLVIDVSRETQVCRTMQRDGSTRQLAESIVDSQVSRKVRLSYANDIIDNEQDPKQLDDFIKQLHEQYLFLAKQKSAI